MTSRPTCSKILRTSRFFPEADDSKDIRDSYADANAKVNEFLYRRVDLEDVVEALLGRKIVDEDDVHDDLRQVAKRNPRGNNSADHGKNVL